MLRAESNPIYRFIHSAQEQLEEETKKEFTKNGFYLFRENTPKSLTFFGGCTVNYFDNYVVVINDEYHVVYFESICSTDRVNDFISRPLLYNETISAPNIKKIKFLVLIEFYYQLIKLGQSC